MNIVWVTSETHPFAKTGGLADVSYALPEALAKRGHKVSVIMPFYPQFMEKLDIELTRCSKPLGVPCGERDKWAQILEYKAGKNLTFYFIEFNVFYDRPALYDWKHTEYSDNAQRFIFLSRAAMQTVLAKKLKPDIIHVNDWHSALCCVYLNSYLYWNDPNFKNCRSVMTIHNIGYQGVFHKSNLLWTGLGWEFFNYNCLEFYDQINLMKAGILTANMVSTVSPTYADEILSNEYGFNLEIPLQYRASQGKLRGILNGIDTNEWNPATDRHLPVNYSRKDMSGKALCKKALQREFNLPERLDVPLFGIVSRLAQQKGIDVFADSLEDMLYHDDSQFVLIGSGDPFLQNRLNFLAVKYPSRFSIFIGYNNELAHLLEAGSDMFLMPSRYEPCGLNQMYSMRYGTVPVVRATGGLEDSVVNYDPQTLESSTGFKFWDLYPDALRGTIRWAADVYRNRRNDFNQLCRNGMAQDFSWDNTAVEYEKMYQDAHR